MYIHTLYAAECQSIKLMSSFVLLCCTQSNMLAWQEAVCVCGIHVHVRVSYLMLTSAGAYDSTVRWFQFQMSFQFCQVCRRGDNESLLLLCDGCDKGTHTYCCVPPLEAIPDGDWYCHHCAQVSLGRRALCSC